MNANGFALERAELRAPLVFESNPASHGLFPWFIRVYPT
jgi:hypothetical protein